MAGFDIESILDFRPPSYLCPACRALTTGPTWRREEETHSCDICGVRYVKDPDAWPGDETTIWDYLRNEGYKLDNRDLFAHASTLAKVCRDSRGARPWSEPWPTMRTFFEVISRARYFVHFSSWGISHVMVGALKVASMRVPVYGFVSNVDANTRAELTEYSGEAPRLKVHTIPSSQLVNDAPHQKIVIVDGLVAFKGSTNLTNAGMRRADRALDLSEVVTAIEEVTRLNNNYFAQVWKRLHAPDDAFVWSGVPF